MRDPTDLAYEAIAQKLMASGEMTPDWRLTEKGQVVAERERQEERKEYRKANRIQRIFVDIDMRGTHEWKKYRARLTSNPVISDEGWKQVGTTRDGEPVLFNGRLTKRKVYFKHTGQWWKAKLHG